MKKSSLAVLIAVGLLAFSCYHARVETGLPASSQVIEKPFASCWIFGLVPPSIVKTAMECSNGVAVVETELSFVNQLVGIITFGIYTPMHIKVTCASGSAMSSSDTPEDNLFVPAESSDDEIMSAFQLAAERSAINKHPVYILFE